MSSDQELLAEQLQILNHLHYTMPDQGSDRDNCDKGFNTEIRALNTVAVLLTTGEPNDVTAVTLDKRGKLELVIAKNRRPSYADDAAVRNLISLLTNPAIDDPEDIFPSIMTYCLKNINKQQLQLHQSLSQFLPTVEQVLQQYSPSLLPTDDELPHLTAYLCFTHSDPTMDLSDIIVNIFQFCLTHSQHPLDSNDKDASIKAYSALCLASDMAACQFSTQWRTSGSHNKPYANWALPAVAYDMDGEGKTILR
ncbi:hypothetical protein JOM56_004898 [Amanita muscaria]